MLFGNIENVSSFPTSKPAVDLRDPKFGQVIAERRFISVSEAAAVTLGGSWLMTAERVQRDTRGNV